MTCIQMNFCAIHTHILHLQSFERPVAIRIGQQDHLPLAAGRQSRAKLASFLLCGASSDVLPKPGGSQEIAAVLLGSFGILYVICRQVRCTKPPVSCYRRIQRSCTPNSHRETLSQGLHRAKRSLARSKTPKSPYSLINGSNDNPSGVDWIILDLDNQYGRIPSSCISTPRNGTRRCRIRLNVSTTCVRLRSRIPSTSRHGIRAHASVWSAARYACYGSKESSTFCNSTPAQSHSVWSCSAKRNLAARTGDQGRQAGRRGREIP
jgi:hypothetical protein